VNSFDTEGPARGDGDTPRVFWSPDYVAPSHVFDTTRKSETVRDLIVERGIDAVREPSTAVVTATEKLIEELHDPIYIEALRTGDPVDLAASQGFRWDKGIWTMARASTSGVVAALELAIKHGFATGSLSSGLHHARRDRGRGYCSINGLAVAAEAIRPRIGLDDRIAIFDVDAHCGGGTNELIDDWALDHVLHLDVSTNDFDRYQPCRPDNELHRATSAADYMATVDRMLGLIIESGCRAVLYNAGMDAVEMVPEHALRRREELVASKLRSADIPCAFVLAGGYVGPGIDAAALADLHAATAEAFIL